MENLQLAICDDEPEDLKKLFALAKQYDPEDQLKITTFFRAADLLETHKKSAFDIVLLDIEMQPPTGFDVARELIGMPQPPVVIFATKSNAYALKGYGIAIRYLQKPIAQEDFFEAMDVAVADATAHRLTFQSCGTLISIRLGDIQYLEAFGHYTIVHTDRDFFRFRCTFKEIMGTLPRKYFVSPHKSYIVNLEHIQATTTSEITLSCGVKIPIGRKRMQEFNHALYQFLRR